MRRISGKCGKREKHTVGPGIWREKLKKGENEKLKLQVGNMVRNTEKRGKRETHSEGPRIWRETKKKKLGK